MVVALFRAWRAASTGNAACRVAFSMRARSTDLALATSGVVAARAACPLHDLDAVITDRAPEGPLAEALADCDVQVLLPPALSVASSP
jgi:hypothetical protein